MGIFGAGGLLLHGLASGTVGALAVTGAAALTVLYLLKLRRRRVVVSFAPLWLPYAGERRSERWARRLRRWLSLAVQLTLFALVLAAAADPQPAAANRTGRSIVVLVDRSASMSATDEPDTRLGAARARATALVSGLAAADRALVASFAAGATAESGFETSPERLRRAVAGITASQEPADLGRALAFAAAVLRGKPQPTIVLVSDGAFSEDARRQVSWQPAGGAAATPGLGGIDVRYLPVGTRARNVGILSFAARRYPADPDNVQVALSVQNFGTAPDDVIVEITAGRERVPVERVRLALAPGERRSHVLAEVAAPDPRLEARLLGAPAASGASSPHADDLALDDHAFAVVPAREHFRVLRIGGPNLYLDGALLSLGRGATVSRAAPDALEKTRDSWASFDVVIFDGVAPAPPPEAGHYLYLDPHGAGSPFGDRGTLRDPVIADVRRGHPLVKQLDLADVNIGEARRLQLASSDVAVAASFGGPLIVARERAHLRVAALAFDVRRSDLPMRAAFPLLVANAFGWLAAGSEHVAGLAEASRPALTGTSVRLPAPHGASALEVRDPDGNRAAWPAAGDVVDVPITRVGFYRAGTQSIPAIIPANLADAVESGTAPARTLELGGRALPPPDPPAGRRGPPLAALLLVAAAALLLLEWWSYHRRWTV